MNMAIYVHKNILHLYVISMVFSTFSRGKRKDESPGPANYNIPAPFGSGPHYTLKGRPKEKPPDPEPAIIKMPSTLVYRTTTFGYRPREKEIEVTPGPENAVAIKFGTEGKKYSFRIKHFEPPNENPSPADYTISREFPGPKQTISSGKRTDFVDPNIIAPPGVYDLPVLFQKHKDLTIGNFIPLPEPERNGPGPAKYIAKTTIGQDTPHYSVPKGPRDAKPNDNPGPADYQRIRPLTSESKIATMMKHRTKLPQPDLCDYPYHKYPGCISPRKFTHGVRPKTSYETMSPGPIYDKKPAIEYRPISIGNRIKYKNPLDDNPSPADYYSTEITPKEMPFCGFYGPTDRAPVDLEKEKKKPGPGYYEEKGQFEVFRKGYYFTSRDMDDFIPDTDGNFIGQISSLGGPKYTIGSKDAY
ncbi:hypothetical protein TRFO_33649 [Tritrichomonas foetus]|uniref:Uncharacterized protein n=1 Tax=Tritrichomonas foetus TaxID=1144522 RepID=A0A1J4JQM6_9EUKA|nr:hypothetical protein TRFO_33649 [Tritrichomonas foetus]|eukprot:OHS99821.1 hypothetical protein TRFO_33649 [Tritrichomonas foetus]